MTSIDVIIPAFNEEECLDELVKLLLQLFDLESEYTWRAIIVENGSQDRSWLVLQRLCAMDPRITAVRLSRNFHMDGGLTAGLDFATADAAVFMTADLQDPPEAVSDFVRQWEKGAHNVYGLVTERQGTSRLRRFNSQASYWLANRLTAGRMPRNASDFRLMDRQLYETLRGLDERNRFMRGLAPWAGFESAAVPCHGRRVSPDFPGVQPSGLRPSRPCHLRPHLPTAPSDLPGRHRLFCPLRAVLSGLCGRLAHPRSPVRRVWQSGVVGTAGIRDLDGHDGHDGRVHESDLRRGQGPAELRRSADVGHRA